MEKPLLLATDFDGTIAGIRELPTEVRIDPDAHDLLSSLQGHDNVVVAIISGRDLDELTALTPGIRAYRCGAHGHELSDPDGRIIRSSPVWAGVPPQGWIRSATDLGLRIEPKKYGLTIHWRGLDGVTSEHPLVRRFVEWAEGEGLEVIEGRRVMEAAMAGARKDKALAEIATIVGAGRVIYAGDDLTDFSALDWASQRGQSFFLKSEERAERPSASVEILETMAELLARFRQEIGRLQHVGETQPAPPTLA